MDILFGVLMAACGAGIGALIYNIRSYWVKNKETPLAEKARGLQIRMTVVPVLLVFICILALLMKKF